MNCPYAIKQCTKCGKLLVAHSINFNKNKRTKWGLENKCKECRKKYYKNNKEHIGESQKKWRENNKEYKKEYIKNWSKDNKELVHGYQKKWRENNKEYRHEYDKMYYENNKEYKKEYRKKYRETSNGQVSYFNASIKRRSKEGSQGNGINKIQWFEMMEFFNWQCAYSGIQMNKNNRSIDHIISLDKNGEHEIWNLVPMYKPYNSSKHTKDMEDWYKQQEFFSEERLQKIYEWQAYAKEKWGK